MVEGLEDFNGRLQGIIKLISVGLGIMGRAQLSITLKVLLHLLDAFHFVSLFRPLQMLERPKALQLEGPKGGSCLRKEREGEGEEEEERRKNKIEQERNYRVPGAMADHLGITTLQLGVFMNIP
ncbi:unnamed protein product, partial [Vitis vinifera]|uniref:Uncharacterized protein n=1 Tax=Vitis vinifera TaxID=29760 RepID=D7U5E7_VITVI